MIRLRKILLSNKPFIIVLFIALLYTFIYINIDRKSLLSDKALLIGYVEDIKQKDDKVILKIKIRHEHIIGYYNSKSFHYEPPLIIFLIILLKEFFVNNYIFYRLLYIFLKRASSKVFEKFIFKLSALIFIHFGILTVFFTNSFPHFSANLLMSTAI